jgi:hypothetical protein
MSRYSITELLREKEWRRCRGKALQDLGAFEYWCRHYVHIQHPEQGAILFDLRPMQLQIMQEWMTERYSLVLKARQIGWSTLVANYALWLAFFWPDQLIVMLSRKDDDAVKLLGKADYAYKRLPEWMRERGPKRKTQNVKDITFDNGSQIDSLPSKEDPARSRTVSLVVVDEWAFLPNAEEAWASIEPIADIGGRVIGLSTANGWGDFFHTQWVKANAGIGLFKPMFFPWNAVPERDDNWYEAKRTSMLEWQLHQEYPSTPEEAFIKSGRPVFDVEALSTMYVSEPDVGFLDTLDGGTRAPMFRKFSNGPLRVWEYPTIGHGYVIGSDVAEGLEHGDYSAAYVIDTTTGKVVAAYHAHEDPDLFGERLVELAWYYNRALLGIEANNHGLTTCKAAQRASYPRIYYRRSLDQRTREQRLQVGWLTTSISKPLAIDELARALRGDITIEDAHGIHELMTYVRDEKGKMGGSPYDDRVMALAIAVQMLNHGYSPTAEPDPEDDYFSFNYFMRKVQEGSNPSAPIGSRNVRA